MVLAQPSPCTRINFLHICFHPTMVLAQPSSFLRPSLFLLVSIPLWFSLNPSSFLRPSLFLLVSIPLWFSLNSSEGTHRTSSILFPSHYGSRSTGPAAYLANLILRFHPTMVLAQRPSRTHRNQNQHRFHPTMVLAQLLADQKSMGPCLCFHPTMVLAQPPSTDGTLEDYVFPSHYGSRSTRGGGDVKSDSLGRFHPTMVLAQPDIIFQPVNQPAFPSHYGSRSTRNGVLIGFRHMFPSHYGSRSTSRPLFFSHLPQFPSHYGSRSTRFRRFFSGVSFVSIPLWFSLNAFITKNYTGLRVGKSNHLAKIGYRPQEAVSRHFRQIHIGLARSGTGRYKSARG